MEKEIIKLKSVQAIEYNKKTILYALGEDGFLYIGDYDPETKETNWEEKGRITNPKETVY